MPYTALQRKAFHAKCEEGDQEMCRLAKEADALPTRRPVKKRKMKK